MSLRSSRWRRPDPAEAVPAPIDDRRRQAIRGGLFGLVLGEQLNGASPSGSVGIVTAAALALAERLSHDEQLHDGELARSIIDQGGCDQRYEAELAHLFASWESGMPLPLAAPHVASAHGGGSTDFAAAVLVPLALRRAGTEDLTDTLRHAAAIIDGTAVGVDAAVVFGAAVAAAAIDGDPFAAARGSARTAEMRHALQRTARLAAQDTEVASLCEHFDTGSSAVDAIPTALYSGSRGVTFTDAVGDALDASSGRNAVPACACALAGARFGANTMSSALVQAIDPTLRDRVERLAAGLAVHAPDTTTTTATLP